MFAPSMLTASFWTPSFKAERIGAADKLLRKLIRKPSRTPRVMVTDKPGAYGAARTGMGMTFEHRQHKGLNNRAEKKNRLHRCVPKIGRGRPRTCSRVCAKVNTAMP